MTRSDHSLLLSALWRMGLFVGEPFVGADGESIVVLSQGEATERPERFAGARVVIDDVVHCGDVAVGCDAPTEEAVVLKVVECDTPRSLDMAGVLIPQLRVTVPESALNRYDQLVEGVGECRCGEVVAQMDALRRTDLFSRLVVERLQRKCGVVEDVFKTCDEDWNQTMYTMLFRAMGDHRNQAAFQQLARAVPYYVLSRERGSIDNVETLLLGSSGLLRRYFGDEHTRHIQQDFEYLARKHSITPLRGGEWTLVGINPNNSPIMRIVQLAGYVSRTDFIFSKLMACRTVEDIHRVLGNGEGRASEYWERHFAPGKNTSRRTKRLGDTKINLLGINFVVPLMFAYGRSLEREDLKERALDLLESLKAESNYITRHWSSRGVPLNNAFDTQAVIQLENEYCVGRGCWKCHIGRGEIKKSLEAL